MKRAGIYVAALLVWALLSMPITGFLREHLVGTAQNKADAIGWTMGLGFFVTLGACTHLDRAAPLSRRPPTS